MSKMSNIDLMVEELFPKVVGSHDLWCEEEETPADNHVWLIVETHRLCCRDYPELGWIDRGIVVASVCGKLFDIIER